MNLRLNALRKEPLLQLGGDLDNETHIIRDLAPNEIEEIEVKNRYWISLRLSFSDIEIELGGEEVDFTIEKLVPRITPFYRGPPRAKWLPKKQKVITDAP